MSINLYQFPISHYCEKIRWALDHKGLEYHCKNLLPGLHLKTTRKIATNSSVPVLEHDGRCVQGSEQIISYLDEKFPTRKLTPVNPGEAQAAREWERYLDKEVGVPIRRYVYDTLLSHPTLIIGFFSTGAPFWAKPFLWAIYPKLAGNMRKYMGINKETAAQSRRQLQAALQRINEAVKDKKYLVGQQFSRADLSAAALLAPLFMPPQYGLKWPEKLPEPLHSELAELRPQLEWARSIYAKHRGA